MERIAPVISRVQDLADPDPFMSAVATKLGGATRLEIRQATVLAKKFVAASVQGSSELPLVIAKHSAAEGTIDLDNVTWLLEQPGVDGNDVIMGFRGAIKEALEAEIQSVLGQMPKTRRARWDIGKSLVERAAAEAVGSRLPWLKDALESRTPSRRHNRGEHDEYEDALNRAVEGDPATDEVVRKLRERLG